ncbi:epimerase [Halalkalibacillus sediminis]|uniref:Epimerase n=1 Tax=Halalkalibacillus sediminis TaxID=2018042 RepID=A0A2I0QS06_9BACI|nr:NAD-dependent epimerase/dehydratase family protein [Halalkalibacillus sediminis]PKR77117.1 epimerase [Halalkalibacillus sediminis]
MRVFIIGGTNFMGPHVVKQLIDKGHEVMVYHRGSNPAPEIEGVKEVLGDREDIVKLKDEAKDFEPDVVVDMVCMFERNVDQLEQALEGIVERLVVISSADVYRAFEVLNQVTDDPVQPSPIRENDELRTRLYPFKDKLDTEFARKYDKIPIEQKILNSKNFKGTVLRLPMVYGAKDPNRRFMNYIHKMNDGRPHLVMDDRMANALFSKGYSENIAQAIVEAIENEETIGEIFNLGEPTPITELEWVKHLKKVLDWSGEIIVAPAGELVDDLGINTDQELHLDTSKFRDITGFTEEVSLEEGLNRTVKWELENPPEGDFSEVFGYEIEDKVAEKIHQ